MLHSTLRMIAVVKHSVSFYQPFFSDVNSWGWSLLLLTVSHTRIQWLQLWFGELALQGMLSWPFSFHLGCSFCFVPPACQASQSQTEPCRSLLLPWCSPCWLLARILSPLFQPSPTIHHSAFLFLHVWIYLMCSEPFLAYPDTCYQDCKAPLRFRYALKSTHIRFSSLCFSS